MCTDQIAERQRHRMLVSVGLSCAHARICAVSAGCCQQVDCYVFATARRNDVADERSNVHRQQCHAGDDDCARLVLTSAADYAVVVWVRHVGIGGSRWHLAVTGCC